MAVLDKLKRMLGLRSKGSREDYLDAWEVVVSELEGRIEIHHGERRLKGDPGAFEVDCGQVLATLGRDAWRVSAEQDVELLRHRVELARCAARIVHGQADTQLAVWTEFLNLLSTHRDGLHYRVRVNYDRLRLDHDSKRRR